MRNLEESLGDRYVRCVNFIDLVPNLPFAIFNRLNIWKFKELRLNYAHSSKYLRICANGEMKTVTSKVHTYAYGLTAICHLGGRLAKKLIGKSAIDLIFHFSKVIWFEALKSHKMDSYLIQFEKSYQTNKSLNKTSGVTNDNLN